MKINKIHLLIFPILPLVFQCTSEARLKGNESSVETTSQNDKKGYLGIIYTEHPRGVRVVNVIPDSPAYKAGLRGGDVIIAIDGDLIVGKYGLQNKIRNLIPGNPTVIRIIRDGDLIKELSAEVEALPPDLKPEDTN